MRRCKLCRRKGAGLIINLNAFCSLDHAIQWAKDERNQQAERIKEIRKQRRNYYDTDKGHWTKKARDACHRYIRHRDASLPCVSCGRNHTGQYHAGHYRPSGVNSALRYDERNIHKQCSPCNSHLSGNLSNYRVGLIARIGESAVVELETNHETKRWTVDELKEVYRYYTDKLKRLKALNELTEMAQQDGEYD